MDSTPNSNQYFVITNVGTAPLTTVNLTIDYLPIEI
jgi:hypothetical protein